MSDSTVAIECHSAAPPEYRDCCARPGFARRASGLRWARFCLRGGDRHVTAEQLHVELSALGEHVSLATVYNTLHQFKRAGLVARTGDRRLEGLLRHQHVESQSFLDRIGRATDGHSGRRDSVSGLPEPPEGMKITHIDVVVRLARK